ncbi:conjugal transfer protein [Alcanivorax balearicus MACL04]|uniref:Conjugal transfer protein n=1 Tax=Alloalcanivorax balearicus MACL04 TaxID=1177182 RepID=A0ABT2R4C5_9GAMM|nr:conjugal transfer protein [Alloalcanivorax balearicus MACL04]
MLSLPLALLLGACSAIPPDQATSAASNAPESPVPSQTQAANGLTDASPDLYMMERVSDAPQVVRTGRYQLWELGTSSGQQQLIDQVVRVAIPSTLSVTVKDALVHLLAGTGYHLCDGVPSDLANQPLPLTHRNLGPASLHEALQVLAGPAWVLQQDPRRREVCFRARLPTHVGEIEESSPTRQTKTSAAHPDTGESATASAACPYCASEHAHQARMKANLNSSLKKQESE